MRSFMSVEEISRLVNAFSELGVCKIRLTGGEPTVVRGTCLSRKSQNPEPYLTEVVELPDSERELFFDIEVDPMQNFCLPDTLVRVSTEVFIYLIVKLEQYQHGKFNNRFSRKTASQSKG